ncbi:MAG: hypothetical protein JWM20_147 [Patescibacteria group bacterium]|nr:hypothetical protein [Patescibacteria group bacterium]
MHAWASFVGLMHSSSFITYAFGMNEGIWMHIIGGAILAKIIRTRFSYWQTVLIVLGIAILWEGIEIFIETPNWAAVLAIYGTKMRYFYDTAGDIIGATVIAMIANLDLKKK